MAITAEPDIGRAGAADTDQAVVAVPAYEGDVARLGGPVVVGFGRK